MGPSPTLNKTTNQKKKDVIDYIFHESETHLVFFSPTRINSFDTVSYG
jgi:hypothetical protein